ncbi:hypothetical protein NFI96_031807 [Prochilodus magdalenae]|nr:hypothetical protein NFI96_031807 [Prochilodus magdalenae]
MALSKMRPATPPVPDICPFLLSDSCHSIQTMEHEYFECPEYLSNPQAEVERTDDFEYEEVELCRLNSQEKLGLTLCYRTDDEEDTAIYVSQVTASSRHPYPQKMTGSVGPNSIAARDGRIREGDRILQINGRDVQDREEAVALLSNEDTRNIVLLVTRPEAQMDEGWLDEDHHDFLEELKMEILEERRKEDIFQTGSCDKQSKMPDENEATCSSTLQHKDSKMGHGGEEQSGPHIQIRTPKHMLHQWEVEPRLVPTGSANQELSQEAERGETGVECDRFQQLLQLKCQIRNEGECGLVYRRSSTIECSLTEQASRGGVERELRMLNEELRSIERKCQSIMQAHQLRRSKRDSPRTDKDSRTRRAKLEDINEQPEKTQGEKLMDKDSSSAYNTAESSRSTPLCTEGSPDHSLQRRIHQANQRNLRSSNAIHTPSGSPLTSFNCPAYSHSSPTHGNLTLANTTNTNSSQARSTHNISTPPLPTPVTSPGSQGPGQVLSSSLEQSPSNPSESDPALPADDERHDRTRSRSRAGPGRSQPSPYHSNASHYQGYMQLLQQHSSSSLEYSQSQLSLLSLRGRPSPPQPGRLEWKVKVRADGTRYVARRPARDRILRERALRIREERSGGMTTDDDAASELKMGRYWSKEERKQQLARAREQRRRREFMQRSRLECLRETAGTSGAEVSILDLSHKKMLKKRNRKILDNWMTIQELMSHGARAPEGTKVHNAFLSVTTV